MYVWADWGEIWGEIIEIYYLGWEEFKRKVKSQFKVEEEQTVSVVGKIMYEIGSIGYYSEEWNEYLIISPNYISTLLSSLLEEIKQDLFISKEDFQRHLHSKLHLSQDFTEYLLKIFIKLSIFILLPNRGGKYFVSPKLEDKRPTKEASKIFPYKLPEDMMCFGRVFTFHRVPLDILIRIFSSIINYLHVDIQFIWKNGLIIKYKENILVSFEYFDLNSYKLLVELRFQPVHEDIALFFPLSTLPSLSLSPFYSSSPLSLPFSTPFPLSLLFLHFLPSLSLSLSPLPSLSLSSFSPFFPLSPFLPSPPPLSPLSPLPSLSLSSFYTSFPLSLPFSPPFPLSLLFLHFLPSLSPFSTPFPLSLSPFFFFITPFHSPFPFTLISPFSPFPFLPSSLIFLSILQYRWRDI